MAFVLGEGYLKPQGIYRTVLQRWCQGSLQLRFMKEPLPLQGEDCAGLTLNEYFHGDNKRGLRDAVRDDVVENGAKWSICFFMSQN